MFRWGKKESNKNHILRVCNDLIQEYEDDSNSFIPSCKEDLMASIRKMVDESSDEIMNWTNDVDYIKVAHSLIANHTFDMLASGRYHLYHGILNPMNCSGSLMKVYRKTMEWGLQNNQLTKEVLDEQYQYLQEQISQVG